MLAAQNLHSQAGEDAARVVALQILNAQNAYRPTVSAKPTNWGNTKKRIDIALMGTSQQAAGWYGAFELKWAAESSDPHQIRQTIVQDATRLAFVHTANMCARILIIGGTADALTSLFDTPHPNAQDREDRRISFGNLLRRQGQQPGSLLHNALVAKFPDHGTRVPVDVFQEWNGRLKAKLLSSSIVSRGADTVGRIFAWQCLRTRGKQAEQAADGNPTEGF